MLVGFDSDGLAGVVELSFLAAAGLADSLEVALAFFASALESVR